MRALVYANSLPRLAATRLLSWLSPRAFVGPLAPIGLREVPEPQLIRERALDASAIISHRYALRDYREAFMACHDQAGSGAVKVLFDRFS